MVNFMQNLISKPFNQGIMAILGLVLGIYSYLASQRYQIPAYVLSDSQIIASSPDNKLKIIWDTTRLNNVKSIKIVVLNTGNSYIDKNNFSTTYPITIIPSARAKVLDAKILKRSRSTLSFTQRIDDSLGTSKVRLAIDGDDGLEGGDGALFQILYTSDTEVNWSVIGRVKNIPEGFINTNLKLVDKETADINRVNNFVFKLIGFMLVIILPFVVIKITAILIRDWKGISQIDSHWMTGVVLNTLMVLLFTAGIYALIITDTFSRMDIPAWIS